MGRPPSPRLRRDWRLAAVATAVCSATLLGQQPTFRAGTDLVTFGVTVTDRRGSFPADLKAADFEVFEDGVRQTVSSFPTSMKQIEEAFDKVVAQIRAQYILGYVSANTRRDGRWRKVEIKVRTPAVDGPRVQTRKGYFAPLQR